MGHNAFTTPWTDGAVEYVRQRAADGWSASKIAAGLKEVHGLDVSYNAVIGKANRVGITLVAHIWPAEATEIFRDLALKGNCASDIARELQARGFNFTRRNCRDKGRSEKIILSTEVPRRPPTPKPTPMRLNPLSAGRMIACEWIDNDADPLPSSRPSTLVDLKSHQCKWPLSRNENGDRLFCGAFKMGKASYCTHHQNVAIMEERNLHRGQEEERLAG